MRLVGRKDDRYRFAEDWKNTWVPYEFSLRNHWLLYAWPCDTKHDNQPRTWPWWRVLSLHWVVIGDRYRETEYRAHRLWVYTRWGAVHLDLHPADFRTSPVL